MKRKHSLIIGGTRGTGRALVKLFLDSGNTVSVIGAKQPAEKDSAMERVKYWVCDVSDQKKLSGVLEEIIKVNGKINDLVFLQRYRGKDNAWEGEMATTVTATMNIIEKMKDSFAEEGGKSIVFVSSVIGRFVADGQPVGYHAAKSAAEAMVRFYAVQLGPKGIRVNCVSPFTLLKEESKDFYVNNKDLMALYRTIVPLGRIGTAEEVAKVIRFLCSDDASFITGQNIIHDGGLSLKWQESLARSLKGI